MSHWLLVDGVRRLLADTCTHEAVQAAEVGGWSAAIWDALAVSGYVDLAGLGLADALAVLTVAGEHAAPVFSAGPRGVCRGVGRSSVWWLSSTARPW